MANFFKNLFRFFKSLYFSERFFIIGGFLFFGFVFAFFLPPLFSVSVLFGLVLLVLTVTDIILLYRLKDPFSVQRISGDKFSNGNENPVELFISSFLPYFSQIRVVDEVPFQFQRRDIFFKASLAPGTAKILRYFLRPVKRGEYHFGFAHIYFTSPLSLAERRYSVNLSRTVPVYPSLIQMHKYQFLALSNKLTMYGVKRIRKSGHTTEFETINEYTAGDDIRTINWKATAKKNSLMVNRYEDEKAQPIYSIIDKGRNMRMPFEGLSLLDYSINASLVLSNIALLKSDKAGIITFSHKVDSVLTADRKTGQIKRIMELLYRQQTGFLESNFEELFITVRRRLSRRSLIFLYTNFESVSSALRQIHYLKGVAKHHVLCVVIFENTELKAFTEKYAEYLDSVYEKVVAEKLQAEKRQIVKELSSLGIFTLLTPPGQLTVNTINRYLEFKSGGLI